MSAQATVERARRRRAAAARAARGERPARLTNDHVLREYAWLRSHGLLHREIAARLGFSVQALEYHLREGRYAGDPRADTKRKPWRAVA